jgi:hypothetical protein
MSLISVWIRFLNLNNIGNKGLINISSKRVLSASVKAANG